MTNQVSEEKIISRVVMFASEFKELPSWLVEKFVKWKPEARDKFFRLVLPLVGYRHVGKGLAALGAMWLCGEKGTPEALRETDRIIKGGPIRVIAWPDKTVFKSIIRNKIVQYGEKILKSDFDLATIAEGSSELNEDVSKYLLPEFAPFKPGGVSHIDFISEENETGVFLGLDIQVSTP